MKNLIKNIVEMIEDDYNLRAEGEWPTSLEQLAVKLIWEVKQYDPSREEIQDAGEVVDGEKDWSKPLSEEKLEEFIVQFTPEEKQAEAELEKKILEQTYAIEEELEESQKRMDEISAQLRQALLGVSQAQEEFTKSVFSAFEDGLTTLHKDLTEGT